MHSVKNNAFILLLELGIDTSARTMTSTITTTITNSTTVKSPLRQAMRVRAHRAFDVCFIGISKALLAQSKDK